ncbi:Regulatory protein UhpC [Gemmata sp. SH-PL17]|uniref:MFS transporter n=1 Tax=Gemmata sp. SH-PL17 TaxID=1630693 RepID=UPI00078ED1CB|nr:MFS transporter [Gemmata sp. SH-PL17]AMV29782.1 Regulatory protein UhpC [Gemmata sp. SH-PL17]
MFDEIARLRRWQAVTVVTLFTGYAGYYVCRSNLSVASPLLLKEYGPDGLTKAHIGDIASVGVLFYAIGKALNGVLAEYLGGRRIFLLGMFASVACTVLFALAPNSTGALGGLASSFGLPVAVMLPFFVVWGANRFVQSMGWGGLVQITSRWFTANRMATVMGVLTMSYLLGDALARLYLGGVVSTGVGWQGVFFAAAAMLGAIGCVSFFTLKNRPSVVGLPEPPPPPGNVYGADTGYGKISLWGLLGPLFSSFTFWLVCLMNVGLTLIRETFNLWNPTYLNEVVKLDAWAAGVASLVFPLVGAVAALFAGWLVDRLNGRYGLVVVSSLVGLVVTLGLFAWVPLEGRTWAALALIGAVALFLLAPYTFCSGVLAVKLGGQRGGSTAAGIIDTAGYLGATLAGSGIGRISQHYGWGTAFGALAGVAALTMLVATVFALRRSPDAPPAEPEGDGNNS